MVHAPSSLGPNPDISQKYKMGVTSKGVANTLYSPPKKHQMTTFWSDEWQSRRGGFCEGINAVVSFSRFHLPCPLLKKILTRPYREKKDLKKWRVRGAAKANGSKNCGILFLYCFRTEAIAKN